MPILVSKDGQQYGPYEIDELQGYVTQGSFLLADQCWQEGWADWQPLSTIISRPPPPPAPAPQIRQAASAVGAEKFTMKEEKTLWEGKPTLWRHAGSIIWSIVISLLLALFTFGIGLLILPIWWFGIYMERKKRKYIVTNKRVKVEFGLFSKSSNEVRIKDIRNVNVVKKGIGGMFGIGSLEFSSAGGSGVEVTFSAISNADEVKKMVYTMQE
jgi:membrane protein YdbS with pleckstrin-like domain